MGKFGTLEILILLVPVVVLIITYMLGYRSGRLCGERVALKLFFGIFLLILAIYTLITPQSKGTEHPLPKFPLIDLLSFGISCLSTILGIGGGILFNPFLQY